MSGTKVASILVSLVGFILPVVMNILGLLIGMIQAYIFAVLAMVYIASGMRTHEPRKQKKPDKSGKGVEGVKRENHAQAPSEPEASETATEKGSI